jgi:hypothetical protein
VQATSPIAGPGSSPPSDKTGASPPELRSGFNPPAVPPPRRHQLRRPGPCTATHAPAGAPGSGTAPATDPEQTAGLDLIARVARHCRLPDLGPCCWCRPTRPTMPDAETTPSPELPDAAADGVRLSELAEAMPLSRASVFEVVKALGITTSKGPGPGGRGRVAWVSSAEADRIAAACHAVHRGEVRIADLSRPTRPTAPTLATRPHAAASAGSADAPDAAPFLQRLEAAERAITSGLGLTTTRWPGCLGCGPAAHPSPVEGSLQPAPVGTAGACLQHRPTRPTLPILCESVSADAADPDRLCYQWGGPGACNRPRPDRSRCNGTDAINPHSRRSMVRQPLTHPPGLDLAAGGDR